MEGVVDNRFEILTVLGEGATSLVYKARHLDMERMVALKFLKSGVTASGDRMSRFQKEAQLASQLHHRNICAVYSFGLWKETLYLAMEYLEGKTLSQLIDDHGPLPFDDFENIFLQVCEALAHAHQKGIVHRDLKPGNILIVGKTAKVVDFGIAKLLDGYGQEAQRLTQTGQMFGTPLYMSPEHCAGMQIDTRSDIYSLGCVMHEAACGQPPFTGENPLDVMFKHINAQPADLMIPPRLGYPASSAALIANAMHKDPNLRYQNMNEVAANLKALRAGTRIEARKVTASRVEKPKRFVQPGMVVLTALLTLGAIGAAATLMSLRQREAPPEVTQTIERQLEHVSHQIIGAQKLQPGSAELGRLNIRAATLAAQSQDPAIRAEARDYRDAGLRLLTAHPEAYDDSLFEMFVNCSRALAPGSTMEKVYENIGNMKQIPPPAVVVRDRFIARKFLQLGQLDQATGAACGLAQSLMFRFDDATSVDLGTQLAHMIEETSRNGGFRAWAYRSEASAANHNGDNARAIELIEKAIVDAQSEYTNARSVATRSYRTKNACDQLTDSLSLAEIFYVQQQNVAAAKKCIERMRQFGAHNNELKPWVRGELELIKYVTDPAQKLAMYKEVRRLSEQGINKWNKQGQSPKIQPGENVTLDEWAMFINCRSRACMALGNYRDVEAASLGVMAQMQNEKVSGSEKALAVILLRDSMLLQHRLAEAKKLEKQFPAILQSSEPTKGNK